MQAKLFLCASSSAIDSRRNSISIFHVLEEIHAPAYPVVLAGLSVIALLELDEDEPLNPEMELRIFLGDQQLFVGPFQGNFQIRRKARVLVDFNGLVIPAPGLLRVVLHSAGHDIVGWQMQCDQNAPPQFNLNLQPAQQQPAEQPPAP